MEEYYLISFNGDYKVLCEIYENVKQDFVKPLAKRYAYRGRGLLTLPLKKNTQSFKYVMDICEKHKYHPRVFYDVYFTKSEVNKCEYFVMRMPYPLELEGTTASDYGTQYVGGCQNCGLGGKPVSDVLVDRKFIRKHKIGDLIPDVFVSEELKDLIETNKLTGVSFDHEVKDYKGREMPKLFTLDIQNVLPNMSESVSLIKQDYRYEECGHQTVYLLSYVAYERKKLEGVPDFSRSKEYVDNNREREIIVSARVRQAFRQIKCKAWFNPVVIV